MPMIMTNRDSITGGRIIYIEKWTGTRRIIDIVNYIFFGNIMCISTN